MSSKISHDIKKRKTAKDVFYTPQSVVDIHLSMIDAKPDDIWFDPFMGQGAYYDNYPTENKDWCEIEMDRDFFEYDGYMDIICSNPPYSMMDKVIKKSIELQPRVISYLCALHGLTARRMEMLNKAGYGLKKMHMLKVYSWYGMSAIVVFEKNCINCISYDRQVHK